MEKPEVLKETVDLFLKDLGRHKQFHGIFQNGRIDGTFFSTRFMDMRRIYAFLEVKGSYNLDKGILVFRLYRTGYYYLLSAFWLIFAIAGSSVLIEAPIKFLFLFPITLGFGGILMYYLVYNSRVKEFLNTFNHYLELTKEKALTSTPLRNQNTDSKPPHSTLEE